MATPRSQRIPLRAERSGEPAAVRVYGIGAPIVRGIDRLHTDEVSLVVLAAHAVNPTTRNGDVSERIPTWRLAGFLYKVGVR